MEQHQRMLSISESIRSLRALSREMFAEQMPDSPPFCGDYHPPPDEENERFDDNDFFVDLPNPQTKHSSSSSNETDSTDDDFTDLSHMPIQNPSVVNDDLIQRLGPRFTDHMPFNDRAIAFGTIRLYETDADAAGLTRKHIVGRNGKDLWPNVIIKHGQNKQMLRLDGLSIGTRDNMTSLRVYIMPQDSEVVQRGNVRDHQKMVKYLLDYVDCSLEAWTGTADPSCLVQIYPEPTYEDQESLFYIFNTLPSPRPDLDSLQNDSYNLQAVQDVMNDEIIGIKTKLYPYQARSAARMIQKESHPALIPDPTKFRLLDLYGKEFFFDYTSGALCSTLPTYNEPRGGILAESMGYGKTLICLAVILATRGHYPSIPSYCMENTEKEVHNETPSLLSMAARQLKHKGCPWKNEFYALSKAGEHYDRCVKELQKYERSYIEPKPGIRNPSRSSKREEDQTIVRLCSSTLIIVPPNLITQWQSEIEKHVDSEAVDYQVIFNPREAIPPWQELIKHDIILLSKSRFEQEYRDDQLTFGCKYKSPLTKVRWLRVIFDEGHAVAGSSRTNVMAMLDNMYIERRWVVSGTPSSTLQGIDVNLASMHSRLNSSEQQSYAKALWKSRKPQNQWAEKDDLTRLRMIITKFLRLQPWSNKRGEDFLDWNTYLAPREQNGTFVSLPTLRQVMQTLIVRHRIQDISLEVVLPPLHTKTVLIKPSVYDKLSVNLFHMILASNYVTSEREDEDYMFHPNNRRKFVQLLNNLGHATFYWIGFTHQHVRDTVRVSETYLNEHVDTVSDEDGVLLTRAIQSGQQALADAGWCAISTLHEMGVYMDQFPELARAHWTLDKSNDNPALLGTTQAREAQKILKDHGDEKFANILQSKGASAMQAARDRVAMDHKGQSAGQMVSAKDVGSVDGPAKRGVTSLSPMKTRKQPTGEVSDDIPQQLSSTKPKERPAVLGFVSAKLTYLCDRLLSHPDEKTIIFYSHNNTAFFIAEALELLHISFLIYANTLSVSQRADHLAKFNVEPAFTVLLMDLKQAGQGLHVAAASRVYLVSPVWESAIESQAIKRAHRLGQTREVYVETLVLQDTFEEALVARRAERANLTEPRLQNAQTGVPTKAPKTSMLDDSVMVQVLKDIRFLQISSDEPKFARLATPQPLVPVEKTPADENEVAGVKRPASDRVDDFLTKRSRLILPVPRHQPDNE